MRYNICGGFNANTDGIAHRPEYNTYIVRVGGKAVEADAWALRQAWNVDQIESILRNGADAKKNKLLDSTIRLGGRLADDLGSNTAVCGNGYTSSYDPIDALYRGAMDPRGNVVACVDLPKFTPDYNPNAAPKAYFDDRFPFKRSGDIVGEAIELLNAKKDPHMTEVDISRVFEGFKLRSHSDLPITRGLGKNSAVLIKRAAFDGAHKTDVDDNARLMAKLGADACVKLRIAFLLYEALKTCEYDRHQMDSDIFKILYSD